jgi:type 1 glutamine amidotransferase
VKRREMLLSTATAALGASVFPAGWVAAADAKRQKVLYFTRNVGFYHSVVQRKGDAPSHSERALVDMGKRIGIDVECTKDGRVFDDDLDQYDAIAFFTNNDLTVPNDQKEPPMSADGKQRLLDAVAGGKGFVAFHSSCACWRTPGNRSANSTNVDPYIDMIGGEFVAHGPQQEATMRVASPGFPGTSGLGDSFMLTEEWYALKNFAKDLHVILVQETAGMKGDCYQRPPYPSTWARMHGKGRVFFTSMAHRENVWVEEPFQQIVLGGLAWALGNIDADVTANIATVTPRAGELSIGLGKTVASPK